MRVPTRIQQKILDFIRASIQGNQIPPTLREIQDHFGYSAIGTVQDHMKNLVRAGLVQMRPRLARGITLTQKAIGIPIIGKVQAGPGQLAFEEVQGYLHEDIAPVTTIHALHSMNPAAGPASKGLFALRVKGDSMVDAGIFENDLVVVKPQSSGKDGDIVVAMINDEEATVKRLTRRPGIIQLTPANKRYSPISVDENTRIIGKVIRVVRQYS